MSNGGIFRYERPEFGQNSGKNSGYYSDKNSNKNSGARLGWNSVQSQMLVAMLTIGSAIGGYAIPARAASPESAPEAVIETIDRLEAAANDRDLDAVIDVYASNFVHDDGFNRRELGSAIAQFWNRYDTLTYNIELLDWEATDTGYTTETEVTIAGQTADDRPYQLESVMRSRQTFVNDRLVHQTTLEEVSTLSAGSAPPTVRIQLPDGVAPGDRFGFDAIVLEPLGDNFLLGGALEESVDLAIDRDPTFIELQPLSAGGLFKTGTVPNEVNDLWISGAIVRKDGITIVTQRLPVSPTVTR